jgi:enoyl-CoA hydratase/carnithine racemase
MAYKDLLYDKSERVATVTFNRPDRMNAWTRRMDGELREAMLDADNDPGVGAVIVTGAGRAYCAGANLGGLSKIADGSESVDDGRRAEGEFAEKLGPKLSWALLVVARVAQAGYRGD